MGTIHFVSGLESLTLKALKDAEDCADILKDLGRIKAIPHRKDLSRNGGKVI